MEKSGRRYKYNSAPAFRLDQAIDMFVRLAAREQRMPPPLSLSSLKVTTWTTELQNQALESYWLYDTGCSYVRFEDKITKY